MHRRLAERPGIFNELEGYLRQAEVAADGAQRRFRLRVRSARDGLKWARLRWTIEGPTPISLHRPATVEMLAPEHDLSIALAYLESHRSDFTELWDKYTSSGSAADWPPLTPEHFQPQIEEVLQRIRDHERRRLTPRDRRPRRGEP